MRRFAVVFALTLACAGFQACRTQLFVPADGQDGGTGDTPATGGAPASGGAGGTQDGSGGSVGNSGGSSGAGGRLTGSGGRPPATGGTTGTCSGQRIRLSKVIRRAEVVLTVGRNMSMGYPFANVTRMSAVVQAVRSAVMANQKAVEFAYQDFPDAQPCSNGSSCCANSATPLMVQNFTLIEQALTTCEFGGAMTSGCVSSSQSRPITDALRNVLTPPPGRPPILGPTEDADRRVILLVDGGPGCYGEDGMAACDSASGQVAQLRNNSVQVHVLAVGEDVEWMSPCLARLSLQGDDDATTNQPFPHHARDPLELTRSLSEIVSDAAKAACVITLLQVPNDGRNVSLEIGNQIVPEDPTGTNGWRFAKSRGTIEVHGFWCNTIQQASAEAVDVWQCQ